MYRVWEVVALILAVLVLALLTGMLIAARS